MAYEGYLVFGDTEIINAERFDAYARALAPKVGLRNCFGCPDLRYAVNRKDTPPPPGENAKSGSVIDAETAYTTPEQDEAPWYDPDEPDSGDFAGLLPLSIIGLDDSTRSAEVIQSLRVGGSVSKVRRAAREIRVSALLLASTPRALDYGQRWLSKVLDGESDCDDSDLSFFSSCPGTLLTYGIDHNAQPVVRTYPGAYEWRGVSGTATPDFGDGTMDFTSSSAGVGRLEFSPVGAVDGPMTFTVDMDRSAYIASAARQNHVPNPSFRTGYDRLVLRRNLAKNPSARRGAASWFPVIASGSPTNIIVARRGLNPADNTTPDLVGAETATYIRAMTSGGTQVKSGAGVGTDVDVTGQSGLPLRVWYWGRTKNVGKIRTKVQWLDSGGSVLSTSTGPTDTNASDWVVMESVFTVPASAVTARVIMGAPDGEAGSFTSSASVADVTNVLIEHSMGTGYVYSNGPAIDYFDGELPPVRLAPGQAVTWEGEPDNSTSIIAGPGLWNSLDVIPGVGGGGGAVAGGGARFMLTHALQANPFAQTPKIPSVSMPANGWGARARVGHRSGEIGDVTLYVEAFNSSDASLGVIATSGAIYMNSFATWSDQYVAHPTVAIPAGTSYVRAFLREIDTTGNARAAATEIAVGQIIVENLPVGAKVRDFFDGSTLPLTNRLLDPDREEYSADGWNPGGAPNFPLGGQLKTAITSRVFDSVAGETMRFTTDVYNSGSGSRTINVGITPMTGTTAGTTVTTSVAVAAKATVTVSAQVALTGGQNGVRLSLSASSYPDLYVSNMELVRTFPNYNFDWVGSADRSNSLAINTLSTSNVILELRAVAEDGSTLGSVVSDVATGRLSLTVDGTGHDVVHFRLIPATTTTVTVASASLSWLHPYGYEDVDSAYTLFPLGHYGTEGDSGYVATQPIEEMIDNQVRRYRRTMRLVKCVEGPAVIEQFAARSACMVKVEFTLVAGMPYAYGEPVDFGSMTLDFLAENTPMDQFVISEDIGTCTPVEESGPVVNPNCDPVPSPPSPPLLPQSCSTISGPVLRRYGFVVAPEFLSQFAETVPILNYVPGEEGAPINVRFYPIDSADPDISQIDPCSQCASLSITYSPLDGVKVDGMEQRAYSRRLEYDVDGDGVYHPTGRYYDAPARHLLTDGSGSLFDWPALDCGRGYLVVVETYVETPASLDLSMAARL